MRSRAGNVLIGLITATLLAACGTSDSPAQTGPTSAPAASQSTKAPKADAAESKGEVIDVRAKLVEQGFALNRIDAIQTNSRYRVSPFQAPSDMSKNHVVGDGNVTCTFQITNATWKQGEPLLKHQIFSASTVRVAGSMHTGDGAKTGSIVSTKNGAEYADVALAALTPQWILDTFDLGRCGDLTLNGKK